MSTPDWIDDYQALVEGRGVAVLDGWSSVVAAGADAGKLLNNFCTNDILKLEVGAACEAFFPNVKGKVLAFGWVWRCAENSYRIVLGSDHASDLSKHLDRYVIREDVELSVGAESFALTRSSDTPVGESLSLEAIAPSSRLLMKPAAESPSVAAEAFDAWRIEQRMPLDAIDVDERNLPQELGRDATAISFTKGCYLGQETVARIDALGHVNQHFVQLKVDGDTPTPGAEITVGDKVVGRVTSAAWSPKHESVIALGYVRRKHAAAGADLLCGTSQLVVL